MPDPGSLTLVALGSVVGLFPGAKEVPPAQQFADRLPDQQVLRDERELSRLATG